MRGSKHLALCDEKIHVDICITLYRFEGWIVGRVGRWEIVHDVTSQMRAKYYFLEKWVAFYRPS